MKHSSSFVLLFSLLFFACSHQAIVRPDSADVKFVIEEFDSSEIKPKDEIVGGLLEEPEVAAEPPEETPPLPPQDNPAQIPQQAAKPPLRLHLNVEDLLWRRGLAAPERPGAQNSDYTPRHVLFSDDLDITQATPPYRSAGQRPLASTDGVIGKAIMLNSTDEAAENLSPLSVEAIMSNNRVTTTPLSAQQFTERCAHQAAAQANTNGAMVTIFSSAKSAPVSIFQRNLQVNLNALAAYGKVDVVVQVFYTDAQNQVIKKWRADMSSKPNFTLPIQSRNLNNCQNPQNASFNFDLFALTENIVPGLQEAEWQRLNREGLSRARSAAYTVSVQISENSVLASDAPEMQQAGARRDPYKTLNYQLPAEQLSKTIQFFFKPLDDLQKNRSEQTVFELLSAEHSLKLVVENNQASLFSDAAGEIAVESGFSLDPIRWDLLGLTLKEESVELYARQQKLAEFALPRGHTSFTRLCLGAKCNGEKPASFAYDEVELLADATPMYCRSCSAEKSAFNAFKSTGYSDPDLSPKDTELIQAVQAFGNAGSRSNISFGLQAEANFDDVTFRIADLTSAQNSIPHDKVEIYLAKYWKQLGPKIPSVAYFDENGLLPGFAEMVPEMLLKDDRQEFTGSAPAILNADGHMTRIEFPEVREDLETSLQPWESKLLWLQIDVPANTPAGIYLSQFEVLQNNEVLFSLPVQFEVKRLPLLASDQLKPFFGMYFRDEMETGVGQDNRTREQTMRHIEHLGELGLNGITVHYQKGQDSEETLEKYRTVFRALKEQSIKRIVLSPCMHPSLRDGYPDYSVYDIAKDEFGFNVTCYGADEPGTYGMPAEMARTMNVNLRFSNIDQQRLYTLGGEYLRNLIGIPAFQNTVLRPFNIPLAPNLGENAQAFGRRYLTTLSDAARINKEAMEVALNNFHDQARNNRALKQQVLAAIPQGTKDIAAAFNQVRADGEYPKIAAANFKEISLWMDGCTVEKLARGECEDLPNFPSEDLLAQVTDVFLAEEGYRFHQDHPYKRMHPYLKVPYDFLGITNAGLDISILSNGFNSRNAVHQEYIRQRVRMIRDDQAHFPGQKPRNLILPQQEEWIYFGNSDNRDELPLTRFKFGFFAYIAQLDGVIPYAYQHFNTGSKGPAECAASRPAYFVDGVNVNCTHSPSYEDPFLDFDGLKASGRLDSGGIAVEDDTLTKDDTFVYESAQGPIKTVQSENIYEGILDYRYLATAEKLIRQTGSDDAKARFRAILRPFQDAVIAQVTPCKHMMLCGENLILVEENLDSARQALAELIEDLQ